LIFDFLYLRRLQNKVFCVEWAFNIKKKEKEISNDLKSSTPKNPNSTVGILFSWLNWDSSGP